MPTNLAAVREMVWDDIQALFAATYVDAFGSAAVARLSFARSLPLSRKASGG